MILGRVGFGRGLGSATVALALSVGGWALIAPETGALTIPAARVAKPPTKADARRFIGRLERAFRNGDVGFLLGHLDPVVIDRYGTATCRTYVATLPDPTRRLPVKKVTGPADFEYTSDGRSATAHKVFTAAVAEVAHGQAPTAVMVHVTANTWFTDCGTALPAPSGGSSPGGSTSDVLALIAGHFTGSWHNLTFGSTGTVDVTVTVDKKRGKLNVATKFTGEVFGAPAPAPETLTASFDISNPATPVTMTSKTFGKGTFKLQPDGSITLDARDVPGARVNTFTSTAKLSPTGLVGTYTVGLADGTKANGTITLTKTG